MTQHLKNLATSLTKARKQPKGSLRRKFAAADLRDLRNYGARSVVPGNPVRGRKAAKLVRKASR